MVQENNTGCEHECSQALVHRQPDKQRNGILGNRSHTDALEDFS